MSTSNSIIIIISMFNLSQQATESLMNLPRVTQKVHDTASYNKNRGKRNPVSLVSKSLLIASKLESVGGKCCRMIVLTARHCILN